MVMSPQLPHIGDRIESDGHYGTVRYVGEVPPTKGVWLGVEWDDPSRGKHDGCHEGKKYFSTKHATSGSFLRPQKANLGIPFLMALQERYGRIEEEGSGIQLEEMFVKGHHNQQTSVEVVGAEKINKKQSHFDQLLEVGLRQKCIHGAGGEGHIAATCRHIRQLDVSANLIPSWKEVARIARQLPSLSTLNVSDNALALPEEPEALSGAFCKLQILFANRMGWTWDQLLVCSKMLPMLEELHVCFNSMSSLSDPAPHLQHLRLLNVEGNPALQDWQHVLELGKLPKLETLILNDTGIDHISFPDCPPGGSTNYFPSLKIITLYNTKIDKWSSINELNKLQDLEDLKIRNNPLLTADPEMTEGTVRSVIIAKVVRLSVLNRTEISMEERKGAELDYLKQYGLEWKASGGNQDPAQNNPSKEFKTNHPRYQGLLDEYGAPEDSELVKKTSALKSSLISLNIRCPKREDKGVVKKKLPATMTVQKLKAMVQRLYKADAASMKVSYSSPQVVGQEYIFDNDLREIGYYAIEDGDTIIVTWS